LSSGYSRVEAAGRAKKNPLMGNLIKGVVHKVGIRHLETSVTGRVNPSGAALSPLPIKEVNKSFYSQNQGVTEAKPAFPKDSTG
jgi:hypothetical protein